MMIQMKFFSRGALAALFLALGIGGAAAQDTDLAPGKYAGDFMIRLRGIGVDDAIPGYGRLLTLPTLAEALATP